MKEKIYVSVLNFPSAMVAEPTLGGGGREEEGGGGRAGRGKLPYQCLSLCLGVLTL